MSNTYVEPSYYQTGFTCPHCSVYSQHSWYGTLLEHPNFLSNIAHNDLKIAKCTHCNNFSYWHSKQIIYPPKSIIPNPAPEMPDNVKQDYLEARSISVSSSRGAAALLRLSLQKLMIHLGESGTNLNNDIASLVRKGLPVKIQQALDYVRVIGNNAVHPGTIDINDNKEIVGFLFALINEIVDYMITKPQRLEKLYNNLPSGQLEQIQKRDGN